MKANTILVVLLLFALAASGCTPELPNQGTGIPVPAETRNGVNATIAALESQIASIASATATVPPPAKPSPSATLTSTVTIIPTSMPSDLTPSPSTTPMPALSGTPTPGATSFTAVAPCNLAQFVSDVTIPDGAQVYVGSSFTKKWQLRNVGSCTWSPDYQVVWVGGDILGGPLTSPIGISVQPGYSLEISLSLTAPSYIGNFKAEYKLADARGQLFGVGSGTSVFFVKVSVAERPAPLAVTHVDFSVSPSAVSTSCPPGKTFTISANIQTNTEGTITYHWIFSDGSTGPLQNLTYSTGGTQTVTVSWTLGSSGSIPAIPYVGNATLSIDDPNHQSFGPASVAITCVNLTPSPTP